MNGYIEHGAMGCERLCRWTEIQAFLLYSFNNFALISVDLDLLSPCPKPLHCHDLTVTNLAHNVGLQFASTVLYDDQTSSKDVWHSCYIE